MTRRACVIGHPVAHSRSPLIHRHWLDVYGIDGDYVREDVAPDAIEGFLNWLGEVYVGANVTIPYKEVAFRTLKRADPVAAALGAANTLWLENGLLCGSNTDVYGFLAQLDESLPGWDRRASRVLVLGGGGAARAIVYALVSRRIEQIVIANRTRARAEALVQSFGSACAVTDWANLAAEMAEVDLLVNTTPLGMEGQSRLALDLAPLKKSAVVCDVVYVPLTTELLAAARARGNPTVDGLGMLMHQAVPGFQRWFGVRPEVTPKLRALLLTDLGEKAP